ncbi:NADH-cytochrome b5 reductase 1, partial [Fusarium oxysporum f. sp. cubense race 1]
FSKLLGHHGHEILHKNCGLYACIRKAKPLFCIILICRIAGRRINLRAFATRAVAVHKPNYLELGYLSDPGNVLDRPVQQLIELAIGGIQQITELHLPVGFQGGDLQSSTMSSPGDNHSLFARHYIDYVYAPGLLLIVGTLIVKKEWAPWAALVAVAFGIYNFMAFQVKTTLKPDVFQEFELEEKTIVSHNVAIYRFKLPSPKHILGLPIGQHISIGAPCPQPDGTTKEIVRSYTPISGDHQPGHVDLLIKSYPQGNISKHMASLTVGQTIKVRGPKGAFVYTPNMVRHFGMIAGGTGITPMLQVIRAIVRGRAAGDKTEVDLIFANVTAQDILLKEDLDALAKQDSGIRVHYVLDKPEEGWTGGVGYVTADMIDKYLPKPADDVKILLCGPPPMISGLKKATESLGFKKARPVSKLVDQVFAF